MATWQVQNAKAHFSEVLEFAKSKGPQIITRHGSETAVVLSIADYRHLTAQPATPKLDFAEFLLNAPKLDDDIFENLRDPNDQGRNIDLSFEDKA